MYEHCSEPRASFPFGAASRAEVALDVAEILGVVAPSTGELGVACMVGGRGGVSAVWLLLEIREVEEPVSC